MAAFVYGVFATVFAADTLFRVIRYLYTFVNDGLIGLALSVFRDADGMMYVSLLCASMLLILGTAGKKGRWLDNAFTALSVLLVTGILFLLHVSSPAGMTGIQTLFMCMLLYLGISFAASVFCMIRAYHNLKNR